MQRRLLLDVVVRKGPSILELLSGKDEPLLVGRDALLVLNLALHIIDGIRRFHFQRDSLACERLDKDLHSSAKPKNEVERRLLLNVVVGKGPAILQLLARKDQALLVRRDALLILNLRLDIVDRVRRLDLERYRLPRERLDEDLHATTEPEHEVERRLLLDVVVGQGAAVLKLLSGENEALLIRGNALLVLDLRLDVVDGIRRLDLEGNGLSRQGLDDCRKRLVNRGWQKWRLAE